MTLGRMQQRRDTAANWASNNPTLAAGEVGIDTTNNLLKVGDGSTAWASLAAWARVGFLVAGGALGTPSSGTLTNCTFPTLNQNTTGSSGSCTGNAANVTGTVAIANGGTGATTLAGAGILVSGGALGTPSSGNASNLTSFPTLNQNTTGTASNVTGTVAIANGGTGASTLAGAAITVGSNNGTATGLTLWKGTAAQYTALGSGRPSTTIYIVVP
jgi:hypothetical protein